MVTYQFPSDALSRLVRLHEADAGVRLRRCMCPQAPPEIRLVGNWYARIKRRQFQASSWRPAAGRHPPRDTWSRKSSSGFGGRPSEPPRRKALGSGDFWTLGAHPHRVPRQPSKALSKPLSVRSIARDRILGNFGVLQAVGHVVVRDDRRVAQRVGEQARRRAWR